MATAERLLSVLGLFTLEEPEWTEERAAERLGASVSTTYRYFSSLSAIGLIESLTAGVYVLGPAIVEYDRQIRLLDPLLKVARRVLQRLVEMVDHKGVALLCRRYRQQVMCVHQEVGIHADPTVGYERGRPMGLVRGAASQVVLAHLPSGPLKALFSQMPEKIGAAGLGRNPDEFRGKLKALRAAGVHITRGQIDPSKVGIAAPVLYPKEVVIGSVGIVLSEADSTSQMLARVSMLVMAAGREIEAALAEHESFPMPPAIDRVFPDRRKRAMA
jgi:DNA-binding IclR family transcriptional regulator